jgi:hypothetical protein
MLMGNCETHNIVLVLRILTTHKVSLCILRPNMPAIFFFVVKGPAADATDAPQP